MNRYLRILRLNEPEIYSRNERLELAALIAAAPGIGAVEIEGRHPRGGYAVVVDVAPDCFDALMTHLDSSGWRPGI